jgi:uncharacterized protein (TIGR02301 family)
MMELIRLEKPPIQQRNKMIQQFNAGYNEAQSAYSSCTNEAQAYAASSAREGEALSDALGTAIAPPQN